MENLLTVSQVADILGMTDETVRRLWRDNRLPGMKPTGKPKSHLRFTPEAVTAFIEGGQNDSR